MMKQLAFFLDKFNRGLTIVEVIISMAILSIAVVIYLRVSTPVVKLNKHSTEYTRSSASVSAVIDSLMTLSLAKIDSTNGQNISKNGITVAVTVITLSNDEAEAILPGVNASSLRKIRVNDLQNKVTLETILSRQGLSGSAHCF